MVFNEQSNEIKSSKIIFITGGTKSGKSEFAEFLGKKFSKITYIALSEQRPEDEHWQNKISVHRKRRPQDWKLIETNDLINILHREKGSILIDSIGGFIMENINLDDKKWSNRLQLLLELLQKRDNITLFVRVRFFLRTYFEKNVKLGCLQSILNIQNRRFEHCVANHRWSYQYKYQQTSLLFLLLIVRLQ